MGQYLPAEHYDCALSRVGLPLDESPWLDLYHIVLMMLPPKDGCLIADIGCGTGRFARLLLLHGYSKYWGLDFSSKRIELAKEYVPEFSFEVGDVYSQNIQKRFADFNTFIFIDILEHLYDDQSIIESLPKNAVVYIAVPNFDSVGHCRFFSGFDSVISRYENYLAFDDENRFVNIRTKRPSNKIFVLKAIRT